MSQANACLHLQYICTSVLCMWACIGMMRLIFNVVVISI